jgi:hypothetical protein
MSDFLKKLKSVFIEEDASKSGVNTTVTTTSSIPSTNTATASDAFKPNIVMEGIGKSNSKFNDILLQSLQNANQQGFDYLEYKQSIQSLANMPMDEKTRYQSAYAMAQTMGVNGQKLIDSALFYIDVLKNEQKKFDEAHEKQRSIQVGNREIEIESLNKDIASKTQLIEEMKRTIEQNQKRVNELKSEIEASTQKVEETSTDFHFTFDQLVTQINKDITNIKNYL